MTPQAGVIDVLKLVTKRMDSCDGRNRRLR
jgi:hypothetical protein